ncbi:hypothetical protein DFS34DRAFT_683399 [Phlyctochytrium arcticum]|nr:hypothetical protein DFS34DRAFT_683399 [Phlyctochytrium arcticum]
MGPEALSTNLQCDNWAPLADQMMGPDAPSNYVDISALSSLGELIPEQPVHSTTNFQLFVDDDDGNVLEHAVGPVYDSSDSDDSRWSEFVEAGAPVFDSDDNVDEDEELARAIRETGTLENISSWAPYGSRVMFLCCTLRSLISNRLSRSTLTFLWFIFKKMGVTIPSIAAVEKKQKEIEDSMGSLMERHETNHNKKVFHSLNIVDIVKREVANPETMSTLVHHPEDAPMYLSEQWHGLKWRHDPVFQSPMARTQWGDFWCNDYAIAQDEKMYRIHRFATRRDRLVAYVHPVLTTEQLALLVPIHQTLRHGAHWWLDVRTDKFFIPVADLRRNLGSGDLPGVPHLTGYFDGTTLETNAEVVQSKYCIEHPLKIRAAGLECIVTRLVLFSDDTSGNKSRRWNPHESWFLQLAGLPFSRQQLSYNIHFVAVSSTIKAQYTHGVVTFNAATNREVLVVAPLLFIAADNPMHSALCCHIVMSGKKPCRFCDVSGELNSTEAALAVTECGNLRTTVMTGRKIVEHLEVAKLPGSKSRIESEQTATGTKSTIANVVLNKLFEVTRPGYDEEKRDECFEQLSNTRELINPLLLLPGFDIHRDSPVEVLHVVLLGVVKYFLMHMMKSLSADEKTMLRLRLQELDSTSFYRPIVVRTVIEHTGTLCGKDFKHFAQIAPFVLFDLVSDNELSLWIATAYLVRAVFARNLEAQHAGSDLKRVIDDFLFAVLRSDATWMEKAKFHLLVHLPRCVDLFGPAIGQATERFESNNHVIRDTCALTNRSAPSLDIAKALAMWHVFRHAAAGGWWWDGNKWIRAGEDLREYATSPAIREVLVQIYPEERSQQLAAGQVTRRFRSTHQNLNFDWLLGECETAKVNGVAPAARRTVVSRWRTIGTQCGERCKVGKFALLETGDFFRITEVVTRQGSMSSPEVSGRIFVVTGSKYNCPVIQLANPQSNRLERLASPNLLIGPVNVQQLCTTSCSVVSGDSGQRVEREQYQGPSLTIQHEGHDETFAVNLFCLRTAWLDLMHHLPRMLLDVPDLVEERRVLLTTELESFEESLQERVAAKAARRAAKRATNAARRAALS